MQRRVPLSVALLSCVLAACASTNPEAKDPAERINRPIFAFNDGADRLVVEPTARGWRWIPPRRKNVNINRFYENLRTPSYAVNNVLQGDVKQTGVDLSRFVLNTTIGLLGFFDPASHFWGLEGREEDFGQTMGVWGVPSGAFVMLPLLGPSGVRDTAALPVDLLLNAWWMWAVPGVNLLRLVNLRSLSIEEVREARESALDWYVFVRNVYQQRREAMIRNGELAEETPDDDFYDLDEAE